MSEQAVVKKQEDYEILPEGWAAVKVLDAPTTEKQTIDMQKEALPGAAPASSLPPGVTPPPPLTKEEIAWFNEVIHRTNIEANILRECITHTRNMVFSIVARDPLDSADFNQWEKGKRGPLEEAIPSMAIEVYRQVRASLRDTPVKPQEPPPPAGAAP